MHSTPTSHRPGQHLRLSAGPKRAIVAQSEKTATFPAAPGTKPADERIFAARQSKPNTGHRKQSDTDTKTH
jgi:hypothetical protein